MKRAALVVAAALALAACATRKEPPPRPFAGTAWHVLLELPVPGDDAFVRFGDGRMEGFGGCNRIAARYVEDSVGAHAIALGRIATGRKACARAIQDAENRLLDVLQSVSSYTITGDVMTMTGSAGTVRFRAGPQESKR